MGCVCSCMKENNRKGIPKELGEKKEKKKRRWWRRIMSASRESDSYVSSDGQSVNVTSSTSSAFSTEGHLIPTTAPTSPPVDISHSASSTYTCSSTPLPDQISTSSSSKELFLRVPLENLTSSPPPCPSSFQSLHVDEVHLHKHSERTSPSGSDNKLPTEPKITAGIVLGSEGKDVGSMTMESLVALQMQAFIGIQSQNEEVEPQNILRSDRKSESGQGEGQGYAPTKSAITRIDVRQLGFPNIGNSCYMNATLQCLLSLSCFWRPIRAQWSSWVDSFGCQILRCFLDLQQARLTSCSTKQKKQLLGTLTACVAARCPTFGEDYEQDAHEFLMLCLLQLKEEGKTLRASFYSYMCPVESMEFHIKSVRTCTSCGLQSCRVEDFNHLSVDLCPTLSDSLHTYFKPSLLELSCECDQGCSASEVVEFFTLPRVLILHVKRFNTLGQKLTDVMEIPAKLDLSGLPGLSSLRQQSSGPAGTQDTNLQDVLDISSPEPANESGDGQGECTQEIKTPEHAHLGTYRLQSVISHLGRSIDSGHYISDVAEGDGERWLSFNDAKVSRTNELAILKCRKRSAYLLFYVHSGAGVQNVAPWKVDQGEVAVSP